MPEILQDTTSVVTEKITPPQISTIEPPDEPTPLDNIDDVQLESFKWEDGAISAMRDGEVIAGDGIQVLYLEGVYAPVLEIDWASSACK